MSLSDTVYTVCSGVEDLTDIVGDRIYRSVHQLTGEPQIVYHAPILTDSSAYRTHGEPPGRHVATVQFDCYGASANEADSVADQLVSIWDGYTNSDHDIGYAFVQNRIDDGFQAGLEIFRVIVEVGIDIGA